MAKANKAAKPNIVARAGKYFTDVRAEMKRVVWPSRTEVYNSSLIVIFTLIAFIIFTFVVDQASSFLIIDTLGRIGR
ncbi:MAG: preprotein translocase subunit SecE [Coriobacteriia bacterium]